MLTRQSNPEILPLRHGLWTHVASRKHSPERIFFGGANELMLFGTVKYVLKADPSNAVEVPWAGRVVFSETQRGLKMKFYQVYLVGPRNLSGMDRACSAG